MTETKVDIQGKNVKKRQRRSETKRQRLREKNSTMDRDAVREREETNARRERN